MRKKTGLLIDSYWSATKIRWILDNVPGARERATQGEARLRHGRLLAGLEPHRAQAARHRCHQCVAQHAVQYPSAGMGRGIAGSAADPAQHAAGSPLVIRSLRRHRHHRLLLADPAGRHRRRSACRAVRTDVHPARHGQEYLRHRLLHADEHRRAADRSRNNLLTTIAWQIGGQVNYALEGSIFIGGAVVQWLRDGLGIIKSASEVEALARSVPHTDGVYLVPAFAGLGAPHWDARARGTMFGVSRHHLGPHRPRGARQHRLSILRSAGGDGIGPGQQDRGIARRWRRGRQRPVDAVPVGHPRRRCHPPENHRNHGAGAAYLAGLAVGYWGGIGDIQSQWKLDRRFTPGPDARNAPACLQGWRRAINASKAWADAV